jgi:hypothetical protein
MFFRMTDHWESRQMIAAIDRMVNMLEILGKLSDVAEGQAGQVTLPQATEVVGVSEEVVHQLVEHGVVEWVVPGVVRLRGGARHPFPRLYANWLLLEPTVPAWERAVPESGVVSHAAAVRIYGVGALPGPFAEFSAPAASVRAVPLDVEVHSATLDTGEYRQMFNLPVTNPGRTMADLVACGRFDLQDLGRVAGGFIQRSIATSQELASALDGALVAGREPAASGSHLLTVLLANLEAEGA